MPNLITNTWLRRRRLTCIAAAGILTLTLCSLRAALWGVPPPGALDEFAYLLAAKTFASGRLAAPPHSLEEHFETTYILSYPARASRYPPGQGLFLAFGERFLGHAAAGVWISTALAAAAICWMMFGYLPPAWALVGTFIAIVRLAAQYWGSSYWGGSVAVLGGALVFGALPRLPDRFRFPDGILMGIGFALLSVTRPFEGLTIALVATLTAFVLVRNQLPKAGAAVRRIVIPTLLVMAPALSASAYYNWRVTGDPLLMPYAASRRMYPAAISLLTSSGSIPPIRYKDLRDTAIAEIRHHSAQTNLAGLVEGARRKLLRVWSFYLGLSLTPGIILLMLSRNRRWVRFAMWTCGVSMLAVLHQTFLNSHYTAPMAGLVFVVIGASLRGLWHLRASWFPARTGQALVCLILMLHLFFSAAPMRGWGGQLHQGWEQPWAQKRQEILDSLLAAGGEHLILVRYGDDHNSQHQWVYNDPDIDRSPVVWARDLGEKQNKKLLAYFAGRTVWILHADPEPGTLEPMRR